MNKNCPFLNTRRPARLPQTPSLSGGCGSRRVEKLPCLCNTAGGHQLPKDCFNTSPISQECSQHPIPAAARSNAVLEFFWGNDDLSISCLGLRDSSRSLIGKKNRPPLVRDSFLSCRFTPRPFTKRLWLSGAALGRERGDKALLHVDHPQQFLGPGLGSGSQISGSPDTGRGWGEGTEGKPLFSPPLGLGEAPGGVAEARLPWF